MTPTSGRQTWPYKLKGPSGNRIGGSEDPQAPNTPPLPPLHIHCPFTDRQNYGAAYASWPFGGIRLIKCKCISWGRKWRGVVQIINWDVFSVKARGFQAGRPEVDLPPKWQAMASVWKRGTLVQLERKASQWMRLRTCHVPPPGAGPG